MYDFFRFFILNEIYNKHENHITKSGEGQALLRTYGRFFAEFLEDLSLVRLGLLDLTTCVGLRYG